jgi:glycosyltransferase involved in cell wall biosynthesis
MKLLKLCYVVHRYHPFPGGSEYYVQALAEESARRGHNVTVFTGEHEGDLVNGVRVTSNNRILQDETFDLIIVHGADCPAQNIVHNYSHLIQSPILYLIIKPSNSPSALNGMKNASYLGFSTFEDLDHIKACGFGAKAVSVRHSIPSKVEDSMGVPGRFKKKYGIETPFMYLTAGGFWQHKGMDELAELFHETGMDDVTLVCLGYMNEELAPNSEGSVLSYIVPDRSDVVDALADADLYIMNSTEEGFGLVLLEAMLNGTPWAARNIAGARKLAGYGFTYDNPKEELYNFLIDFPNMIIDTEHAQLTVLQSYLIGNTVNDIENVLKQQNSN